MIRRALSISTLTLCLAALSPATAFSQTSSDVSSAATPAVAQAAYVYVGTTKGVYLYSAASNGSLSLVSGSPFSIAGNAVGSNGKYFLSLGTNYLHSYPVASNGALKGQVSQINTALYPGTECGTAQAAVLDHTGQDVYVQLHNAAGDCVELQSFKDSSTGALSFLGATQFVNTGYSGVPASPATLIALTGNGDYGYSIANNSDTDGPEVWQFKRESSGAMMTLRGDSIVLPQPSPPPPDLLYLPGIVTGDPTNHLAFATDVDDAAQEFQGDRLASYTVSSDGSIATSNSGSEMPKPQVYPTVLNMSPSGQFLAVGGNTTENSYNGSPQTPGLQVFHFNGANPITSYSGVLTAAPIDEIHWDNNNHLYALSNSTKKLYVYTVTSSSITAVPGSPYTIASTPNALVVAPVSTSCSAPSSPGVNICSPSSGSTVSSPVSVEAASKITGTLARVELWVDGVKKYTETTSTILSTSLSLSAGSHRFTVIAVNTAGTKWQAVSTATVK